MQWGGKKAMRKRLMSTLLNVAILVSMVAVAGAEDNPGFTFFNGAQWGMSEKTILEIEGREADRVYPIDDSTKEIEFDNESVSKYTATRAYIFSNGFLRAVVYYNLSSTNTAAIQEDIIHKDCRYNHIGFPCRGTTRTHGDGPSVFC